MNPKSEARAAPASRVVIENIEPAVLGGRYPAKRTVGDTVTVSADVHADGHDVIRAVIRWRNARARGWSEAPMEPGGNDRWTGSFVVTAIGTAEFAIEAWIDAFAGWRRDLEKKIAAEQDVSVELLVGAEIVASAAERAPGADRRRLAEWADRLAGRTDAPMVERIEAALDAAEAGLLARHPDRSRSAVTETPLRITVDPVRARFSAWYEMFPRSASPDPDRHGTFTDVEARLPYVAGMGFDVLYLPPIHPIGRTHRKGRNNAESAAPGDPGSPWAIGGPEGGHTAIHPELGTLDDFRRLVTSARALGIEVALDLAFQCSPDHPWVKEHPEWLRTRPDGSIQYAENPPKKYQDIYPIDFDTPEWKSLWDALLGVVDHWIDQGVRVFRVDNPHTKPYPFWEWLIANVKERHPDVIFLAEAFTRPRVMERLAMLGFSQSYNYFPWRNTGRDLREYLTLLTRTDRRDYFRPNLWPNTPDILPEFLQIGGRTAFRIRLILAATLGASYGIYGPAFELCESRATEPGREDYLDSEKYERKTWNLDDPGNIAPLITRINRIRRENAALQDNFRLRFHETSNEAVLAYTKTTPDFANTILTVVNLDPHHRHSSFVELPPGEFDLGADRPFQVHDLLSDARYLWSGGRHYVELDPEVMPAQIFRVRRRVRTEHDFDYYL